MTDTENGKTKPLEYQRKQSPKKRWKWTPGKIFGLSLCMTVLCGITVAAFRYEGIGKGIIMVVLCLSPVLWIFMVINERKQRNKNYEAEYDEYDARRKELLAIAKEIYATGPIGTWRAQDMTRVARSWELLEERYLQFDREGKGLYVWRRGGDNPFSYETVFEYKHDTEGFMLIRLIAPATEQWQRVEYGFETQRVHGEPEVVLWVDGNNPLPPGSEVYWPFAGEFLRSK